MNTLTPTQVQELIARHDKLVNEVFAMREKQKFYFSSRGTMSLDQAKKAERKVDQLLKEEAEIRNGMSKQQSIF